MHKCLYWKMSRIKNWKNEDNDLFPSEQFYITLVFVAICAFMCKNMFHNLSECMKSP